MDIITNDATIKFLIECYTKANKLRAAWFNVNSDRLYKAAAHGKGFKNISVADVITTSILPGIEALRITQKESAVNRLQISAHDGKIYGIDNLKKTYTIKDVGLAPDPDPRLDRPDADLSLDPLMRPTDPRDREVIYKAKPEFGRLRYLRRRAKILPENKYYFNECTSWDYGWRFHDSRLQALEQRGPRFGHYCAMMRDSKSRSGPKPDPPHYKIPNTMDDFCNAD